MSNKPSNRRVPAVKYLYVDGEEIRLTPIPRTADRPSVSSPVQPAPPTSFPAGPADRQPGDDNE